MLTHEEAREVYDKFGAKQDDQAWYEDAATAVILEHGAFGEATHVVELGCGTGRFAELLFREYLSDRATYSGVDISSTMIGLASTRLSPFSARVALRQTSGETTLSDQDASADRFVSNYVLDLLSDDDIRTTLSEAHRILKPDGLLCLTSLTFGPRPHSWFVSKLWRGVHRLRPTLVGGCRPIRFRDYLGDGWEVLHRKVVTVRALSSEALVARPQEQR